MAERGRQICLISVPLRRWPSIKVEVGGVTQRYAAIKTTTSVASATTAKSATRSVRRMMRHGVMRAAAVAAWDVAGSAGAATHAGRPVMLRAVWVGAVVRGSG